MSITTDEAVPNQSLDFFWLTTKPHRAWLWSAVFLVIIASGISAFSSIFFKLIIDAVEVHDVSAVMFYGLLYPVVIFLIQVLYRLSGVAGMQSTVKTSKNSTDILINYLLGHTHTYFSNRFAGSVTSKVRNVSGALESIIPDILWSQLTALVSFLVTFVMIWFVDVQIALIFLLLLTVLAFLNKILAKKKADLSKINAEASTILQGGISDMVANVSTVRQYVRQAFELDRLKKLTTQKQEDSLVNWFFTEKMLFYNVVTIFIFAFSMFWLLTTRWEQGLISTGDFVLVLALVSQITGAMVFIGRAFNSTARAIGELREGLDDLLLPYSIKDIKNASTLKVKEGEISWQKVKFKYENKTIFEDFDLTIAPKQKLGLVGSSGAGKTTFVSLLLRQFDLVDGGIFIDGQNIAEMTQNSLRENIAVVPQEPMLFHRTIRENIAYANPEATLSEIEVVAKLAQAHEFISELPFGYETIVGERGIKLSGGQKQRIAIARAMLKNSPILVLDEATSALDSESEVYIQEALKELMKGKTVIAIAHRLSTLREMDRIIVLNSGEISEDGSHESLKEADGVYSKLWAHQAGGFLLE